MTENGLISPAIDAGLARGLVERQFPQWARLALVPLAQAGSDHVIYRLGAELTVRLPRHAGAIGQAAKEARWLPRLAPHLPLAIPEPVAVGQPDLGYPWPWAVTRWLDGEVASVESLGGSRAAAVALAGFLGALQALQGFEAEGAEGMEEAEGAEGMALGDGESLATRDKATRQAIAAVDGVIDAAFDAAAMTELWDSALAAPAWHKPAVWFHGDFHTGNLLTNDGRVTAVIDFGGLGRGDPACDLTIAYTLMTAATRAVFREALDVDDATWLRGRGWALATGLNAYTSYAAVNARVAAQTTRQINEALVG